MQQLIKQLTIKLIQGNSTPGQLYKPTGNETDLASYTQTGLAGQQFTASNNRDIPGYKACSCYNRFYSKNIWYPW